MARGSGPAPQRGPGLEPPPWRPGERPLRATLQPRAPRTEAACVAATCGQGPARCCRLGAQTPTPVGTFDFDTREGPARRGLPSGGRGLQEGTRGPGGGKGGQDTHEVYPIWVVGLGTAAGACGGHPHHRWRQDMPGGAAGLTGGPWGPGGPGVCEEQAQAEGKAGQVSPSFWEKGDPHH